MSVRVSGFAKGLVRCLDFESIAVEELDRVLVGAAETLEMDYIDPSADVPFIQSGSAFAGPGLRPARHGSALAIPALGARRPVSDRRARVPDGRGALGGQLLSELPKRSWCGFRRA